MMNSETSAHFHILRRLPLQALLGATALLFISGAAWAIDCPSCQLTDLPDLAMFCPSCDADLHRRMSGSRISSGPHLRVEIRYTGRHPERLPKKARLLINGRRVGILERLADAELPMLPSDHGRFSPTPGTTVTAMYRGEWRDMQAGQVNIELEMTLPAFFGLAKKRVRKMFLYTRLAEGETTQIVHTFERPDAFSGRTPFLSPRSAVPKGTRKESSSRTPSLSIPLFD